MDDPIGEPPELHDAAGWQSPAQDRYRKQAQRLIELYGAVEALAMVLEGMNAEQ